MASRESVPNAAALEQIEAPSREVAEAKRRAAEADAADKPALKDAIDTLRRLEGENDPGAIRINGLPPMIDGGDLGEHEDVVVGRRGPRGTLKGPGPGRVEQQTSPSLARVLAGTDANDLAEDTGEGIPDEGPEATPAASKVRPLLVVGVAVLALALILGMLAIALWSGPEERKVTEPSATSSTPSATETARATATASATPTETSAVTTATESAVTASEPRHSASPRASAKASAKTTASGVPPVATSIRSNPPPPASSLPPGWNPNI